MPYLLDSLSDQFRLYGLKYWRASQKIIHPEGSVPRIVQYEIRFNDNKYEEHECWMLLTCLDWAYIIVICCENGNSTTTEVLPFNIDTPLKENYYRFLNIYRQIEANQNAKN